MTEQHNMAKVKASRHSERISKIIKMHVNIHNSNNNKNDSSKNRSIQTLKNSVLCKEIFHTFFKVGQKWTIMFLK